VSGEGIAMPITYQIDPERNLVLVEGHGVLTDKDFPKFRAKLFSDPLFQPGMKELADYRSVERHELTTDGFIKFLEQEKDDSASLIDYRIAVVTTSDLHYGFSRMYMSMMEEYLGEMRVFRDMEEAKAWLFDRDA
jgi:hypothetical protein